MGRVKRKQTKKRKFNEYDESTVVNIQRTYRKKIRKRRMFLVGIVLFSIVLICYFKAPVSRINQIDIVGNHYVDSALISENLGCSTNSIRLFTFTPKIKKNLKKIAGIKDVKVKKHLFGGLEVQIVEDNPIAYQDGDTINVILDNGEVTDLTNHDFIKNLQQLPSLKNFDQDNLKKFAKEYVNVLPVVREQFSEIILDPETNDPTRIKIISNNNKICYVRIEDMVYQLKYYNEIIQQNPTDCYFDFCKGHVYKRSCN